MLEATIEAAGLILQPAQFGSLLIGCALGFVVGVFPGLGGVTGLAILFPFIYGMAPLAGIALLLGAFAVTHTADTFSSVLIGVPGSSGSQATILDGYPLAKQGQATKALSAAFASSVFGGITGGIALFFLLVAGRFIILAIGSPELLMLGILGLSMAAVVSGTAPLAGLTAGALGVLVGGVGIAPGSMEYRFTFGTFYLMEGVSLAVVALGLFAVPELYELLRKDRAIARTVQALDPGQNWEGVKAFWANRWLSLRSALLGAGIGIIPGVGGAVVDWIAYGFARQSSRNPEQFGHGDIRGVIAPESANNAKSAGALVPTLLFGLPGSGSMAILLGGLAVLGYIPGPTMISEYLPVSLMMIWGLIIANIIACAGAFAFARFIAKLTLVRGRVLVPLAMPIIIVAAHQWSFHHGDLIKLGVFALLGLFMMKGGIPRAPFLIGFVLSMSLERYLRISLSLYGFGFLARPGVIILGAFTVAVIVFFLIQSVKERKLVHSRAAREEE